MLCYICLGFTEYVPKYSTRVKLAWILFFYLVTNLVLNISKILITMVKDLIVGCKAKCKCKRDKSAKKSNEPIVGVFSKKLAFRPNDQLALEGIDDQSVEVKYKKETKKERKSGKAKGR